MENFEYEIVKFFKTGNRARHEFRIPVIKKKFLDKDCTKCFEEISLCNDLTSKDVAKNFCNV